MTSNAAPHPPTTTIAEPYHAIENRITKASISFSGMANRVSLLQQESLKFLSSGFVHDGMAESQSKKWNGKLKEHEGRTCLNRLDKIGLHVRKQSVQEIDRKEAQDPDTILWWLREFKRICDEYGIQQCDIYNFDESGFRIGVGKNQRVGTYAADRPLSSAVTPIERQLSLLKL